MKPRSSPSCDLLFFFRENGRSPSIREFIHLLRNSLYRATRIVDLEGFWVSLFVNHFSEGGVNANHNGKICKANLTSRLMPEIGRSQSNEP